MHQILRHRLVRDDVGDRETPARLGHAEHLAKDFPLVRSQVDHAVRDDQVDGVVGDRHGIGHPLAELDVGSGIAEVGGDHDRIFAGDLQHRIGHVDANHMAGGADEPRGLETVNAAARSDVQDGLSRADGVQSRRGAAPIRNLEDFFRNEGFEVRHVIAGRAAHLLARAGGFGITVADFFLDFIYRHGVLVMV